MGYRMSQPSKQDILDFVDNKYGTDVLKNLKNIHKGGQNNQKGRDYENFYQLYRVFQTAANDDYDCRKHVVGMQQIGFVDDICHIDYENKIKYNYQAKNSSGSAATWTDEISERFRKQREIDASCFGVSSTQNYLLVSNASKATENIGKIPQDLKDQDTCEYFEAHSNTLSLVENTDISQYIEKLTEKNSHSITDYACSLILGILQSGNYSTIDDVFSKAESEAHPNPFKKFRKPMEVHLIPDWVVQILTNYSNCARYSLEYETLIVCINGSLTVECKIKSLMNIPTEISENTNNIKELAFLLMSITAQDIEQSLSSSEDGEV